MDGEMPSEAPKPNRGGRPKGPAKARAPRATAQTGSNVDVVALFQTPEAQQIMSAAITAAVAEATQRLSAQLTAQRERVAPEVAADDHSFARTLATQIAAIADQGAKTTRVAPEEMVRREDARDAMERLIVEARVNGDRPQYEITRTMHLDERLIQPTWVDTDHRQKRTQIEWAGVPNEFMVPMNSPAQGIFDTFMISIGGSSPNLTQPAKSTLRVLHQVENSEAPQTGKPRMSDLAIIGRGRAGDVIQTNVLGTIAQPARQVA